MQIISSFNKVGEISWGVGKKKNWIREGNFWNKKTQEKSWKKNKLNVVRENKKKKHKMRDQIHVINQTWAKQSNVMLEFIIDNPIQVWPDKILTHYPNRPDSVQNNNNYLKAWRFNHHTNRTNRKECREGQDEWPPCGYSFERQTANVSSHSIWKLLTHNQTINTYTYTLNMGIRPK